MSTSCPITVADIRAALESAYPLRLAEEWDTGIGLTCGDPQSTVRRVLLAVDVDPATVAETIEVDADLLVTHHPFLFRPVQSVAADTDKGALLHALLRRGVAHYAAHTNADRAIGGVSDALGEALGVRSPRPLVPVPSSEAMPGEGLGAIGELPTAMTLRDFTAHVARSLPATSWGVRAAGDAQRTVHRVAVCGGAGSSVLDAATLAGADVVVTSDVTHHVAAEHVASPRRPAIVEVAHWAGEWPWLSRARAVIVDAVGSGVEVVVSTRRTDAWTVSVGTPDFAE